MAGETIDSRRLLVAVGLVAAAIATLAGLARLIGATDSDHGGRTATASSPLSASTTPPGPTSAPDAASGGTGAVDATTPTVPRGEDMTSGVPNDGDPHAAIEPPEDLDGARVIAASFATAFSSYRWDEPADAPLERARPFLTERAAAALSTNSGALAGHLEREAREEVAEATVDAVFTEGFTSDSVGVTVIVLQRVTTVEDAFEQLLSYHLVVERSAEGWLVAEVGVA